MDVANQDQPESVEGRFELERASGPLNRKQRETYPLSGHDDLSSRA